MVTDDEYRAPLAEILEEEIRGLETDRFAIWHYMNPGGSPVLIVPPPEEDDEE